MNKLKSVGYVKPQGSFLGGKSNEAQARFKEEREEIKKSFAGLDQIDWMDSKIQEKLKAFSKQVISTTTDAVTQNNLIDLILPTETIAPGETLVWREVTGGNVWFGSYGAAVRMSRPQLNQYTATPQLKEIGLKLELTQIQTGKYSPSELGVYMGGLITAWRNRALFVTTLAGMSVYQSSGAQYQAGTGLGIGTMLTAVNTLTDEAEIKLIVGRRSAIHQLSYQSAWSNDTLREFEQAGQVGKFAGIPVFKVNSFTDSEYGLVYPFPADELWIVSELPAGRAVVSQAPRMSSETILSNETQNIYMRFEDGFGIWHTNRLARVAVIT